METREFMENFQAQTKNLYMCLGHLKVWKKSHTFVCDIYEYFLQYKLSEFSIDLDFFEKLNLMYVNVFYL